MTCSQSLTQQGLSCFRPGMTSINSFVLNAAIDKAKQIMERERALKLSQRDAMMLADALDAPTKPNARLQQAAERYKAKT